MLNPSLPDTELLKAVLEPLLEDFQFWFKRTRRLLEQEQLDFLGERAQANLLNRVRKNQHQVTVAQSLLEATGQEASIEMSVLTPWHQLVLECWQVTMRFRQQTMNQSAVIPASSDQSVSEVKHWVGDGSTGSQAA